MLRIFGDAETYYDDKYSLRKISPIEYILDSRWETLGWAVAIEHEAPILLPQDEIVGFLTNIKQPYCFISHNALFDACILAFKYNIHPDALLCTMNMARSVLLHEVPNGSISLASVLKHLKLKNKQDFIGNMSGKHWADLTNDPGLLMAWTSYAINDLVGCRDIFFTLCERFPPNEALVMDRVIRMTTQPKLWVNSTTLANYIQELKRKRLQLLSTIKLERVDLMSNLKLAELLEELGVEPPTKISLATGKPTLAFAKTDEAFVALLEHENPQVQMLVAARLGVKSTIEETRSERMRNIAVQTRMHLGNPLMPMPLKYSGAHTHRFSGDWKLNVQNLSSRKSKEIRSSIVAPYGYTIVAVDASQIEARLTAWLAGQIDMLNMFAIGEDIYRWFAGEIFGGGLKNITKAERFVGKTCILGLGFGMSATKLLSTITALAREQGIDIRITEAECIAWVQTYRRLYNKIASYWGKMGKVIEAMAKDEANGVQIGPCTIEGTTVIGPGGLRLYYDNLRFDEKSREYWYDYGQTRKKLYGGKLLENVVQHLDRQYVVEAGIRTEIRARKAGIPDPRIILNVHDENVHCVPDAYSDELASIALEEMRRNVKWSVGLPFNAEVKTGINFGELQQWKPKA